jgi:Putative prokaryotic signal transducing protein
MSRSRSHSPPLERAGVGGGGRDGRDDDEGGGGGDGGGGGPLVTVASTRNLMEAELLQGLLTEAGIPSVVQRSVDNPDFLAAGPRDVKVLAGLAAKARAVLAETMTEEGVDPEWTALEEQSRLRAGGAGPSPERLAIWVGAVFLAGLILAWIFYQLG